MPWNGKSSASCKPCSLPKLYETYTAIRGVDFAFLAADRNSCHILFSNSLWEVAPGTLLAEESGCVTATLNGQDYGFRRKGLVIAVNQKVLDQVVKELDRGWRTV